MQVHFTSDGSKVDTGWKLQLSVSPEVVSCMQCSTGKYNALGVGDLCSQCESGKFASDVGNAACTRL